MRRSRNRAGGALQPSGVSLHTLPDLAPLGGTKTEVLAEIERRIGLSFEQFTRSVLLAQNEFSAFLRTDENERGELLETLTGSAVYSDISRRAFERWRQEQEALRRLTSRLQDAAPLAPDARAALDTEGVAAQAQLDAVDIRRAALETRLRWHQEWDRLRQAEAQAESQLAQARAQAAAADERRRRLAALDAVQPARALVADLARLAAEQRQVAAQLGSSEQELAAALAAQRAAAEGMMDAERKVDAADAALRAAGPLLDQAKGLDGTLATLAPAHAKARAAREALALDAAQALAARQAKDAQLLATTRSLHDTQDWLDGHGHRAPLAAQWARWEQRLVQAEDAARADAAASSALLSARDAATRAAAGAEHTAAALHASTRLLAGREEARQAAMAQLAIVDADALRAERQAAQARREDLAALEQTWTQLAQGRARLNELTAQAAQAERARDAAQEALAGARAAGIALDAQAAQAERSLKAAQLACADGVEKLRATLVDGDPCPVCGSEGHPYRHQDDRLHALLDDLAAEVEARRQEARANLNLQAEQRAAIDASGERLTQLAAARGQLEEGLAQLDDEWRAHPLADGAAADVPAAWFAQQQAALRTAFADLDAREGAHRTALVARDGAQRAWDDANREHARLLQAAQDDQGRLAKLEADIAALQARQEAAAGVLADAVAELDPVLQEACGAGWRAAWQHDPAGWRAARAQDAAAWSERAAALARLTSALATQQAELAAAGERVQATARQAQDADAEFARIDADLAARRTERAALFEGRPARDVEAGFMAAVGAAREGVNACQAASLQAAQREARVRETQAQANARIADLQGELAAAAERLQAWIEDFAADHPGLDPIANETQLNALLQVGTAWIAQERAALQELDAAARQAAAIVDERRGQRVLHEGAAPPDAGTPSGDVVAQVARQLDAVLAERRTVHETAAALAVRIREDDARRVRAAAMMDEIERQRAIEDRWAKLADLIGSADGKKFRNYAQQFTLDVLLGYANTHLAQLARRYRLERVANGAGPSLALMVRDQDMGGEVRSVNSLSGGESFLVSLALALGLASLSSNRVKVESLFIDEGFGSLDSDTLGVAMDALDALQSLGRKVGVISHVQEMTERIATKVLVRPAGGGSSAITVAQ